MRPHRICEFPAHEVGLEHCGHILDKPIATLLRQERHRVTGRGTDGHPVNEGLNGLEVRHAVLSSKVDVRKARPCRCLAYVVGVGK